MQCDEVIELLPGIIEDDKAAPKEVRKHVDKCLRCQAEVVHYKKLLRSLHALRVDVLEPTDNMIADALARLEKAGERRAINSMLGSRKGAYAGGIAVATVAGVAGAVIFASRKRSAA